MSDKFTKPLYNTIAIESSCDNSSVAIMNGSNVVEYYNYNQDILINKYGGYIPNLLIEGHERAFETIFKNIKFDIQNVNYIAVTSGPGILMSISIGYNIALYLFHKYKAKIIFIDHIEAHAMSGIYLKENFKYPFLSFVVTGGHCILFYVKNIGEYEVLISTSDDAPGEVLDKIARLLKIYPCNGAGIEKYALHAQHMITDLYNINFGRMYEKMSFSGIKTRFAQYIYNSGEMDCECRSNICLTIQYIIANSICVATKYWMKRKNVKDVYFNGGVMNNDYIRNFLYKYLNQDFCVYFGDKSICSDNAIMIGFLGSEYIRNGMFQDIINKSAMVSCDSMYDTFSFSSNIVKNS